MSEFDYFTSTLLLIYCIVTPFTILGSLFIIFTFLLSKRLKNKKSLSFIFAQAVFDLIIAAKFLLTAIFADPKYFVDNEPVNTFCQFLAVFGQVGTVGSILYFLSISIIIASMFHKAEKQSPTPILYWPFHVFNCSFTLLAALVPLLLGNMGVRFFPRQISVF